MSRETEIANLLRQAQSATTLTEQREFVRQAELLRSEAADAKLAAGAWNAEDAVIRDTLIPGRVHELHTASTDWLLDLDTSFDSRAASQQMVAEATLWFGRVSPDVKSHADEYTEQARGLARRLSGKFGDVADVAERAFLDEASRLRTQAVRSGLVSEASELADAEEGEGSDPIVDLSIGKSAARSKSFVDDLYESLALTAASTLPQVGDTGNPVDNGTMGLGQNSSLPVGATDSNRGPVMQELNNNNPSQDVVPVNDPGLSQSQPFPVSGKKEGSMQHVTCPNCGGNGKVAVRREAASGLPQIDQIVDPHDAPSATPYPPDVAFPWVMNPQGQVNQAIGEAESQISERNSRSPLAAQSRRYMANGRDNSGWMGDMGGRGTDYPGYSTPVGGPGSTGYVDPVYGQGGDQGNQDVRPYGHQEADDFTNNPGQNWSPGQPTQADQAWQSVTNNSGNVAGPGGSVTSAWNQVVDDDETLQAALAYVAARRQKFNSTGR